MAPNIAMATPIPARLEKVKIESSGAYFVVKLVLTGKMVHVGIEKTLNEHAAEGWWLEQIIQVGNEAYAILSRHQKQEPKNTNQGLSRT